VSPRCADFPSVLPAEMREFLAAKRALGRRYTTEESVLRLFDAYLAQQAVSSVADVTAEVVDAFLAAHAERRARSYNELLGIIRRLFAWLVRQEKLSVSPVRAKPRRRTAQRIPCLLGPDDARRLLDLAGNLPSNARAPLRGPTYRTVFALLYGLGLRVGEVSRLRRADVDLGRDLLIVRGTKFGKSRLVPFGPRLGAQLRGYLELRESSLTADAPLFSFTRRGSIHPGTISQTFHHLVPRLGLVIPPGVAPPRVHDLRHAFAVGTLLRWYRDGVDPATRLFHLATFLGHVSTSSTAVYLTITSELLAAANGRFEGFAAPVLKQVSP
jgi:site-specific recombinase XerD